MTEINTAKLLLQQVFPQHIFILKFLDRNVRYKHTIKRKVLLFVIAKTHLEIK